MERLLRTILRQNINESGATLWKSSFLYSKTPQEQKITRTVNVVIKWMHVNVNPNGQFLVTYLLASTTDTQQNQLVKRG